MCELRVVSVFECAYSVRNRYIFLHFNGRRIELKQLRCLEKLRWAIFGCFYRIRVVAAGNVCKPLNTHWPRTRTSHTAKRIWRLMQLIEVQHVRRPFDWPFIFIFVSQQCNLSGKQSYAATSREDAKQLITIGFWSIRMASGHCSSACYWMISNRDTNKKMNNE